MAERPSVPTSSLPPGSVGRAGAWTVVRKRDGQVRAVSSRCRHQLADLSKGTVDKDGCLVCPWHQSAYDVGTGRMTRGPQGVFAKVPGLGAAFIALTRAWPLRRGRVTVEGDELVIE